MRRGGESIVGVTDSLGGEFKRRGAGGQEALYESDACGSGGSWAKTSYPSADLPGPFPVKTFLNSIGNGGKERLRVVLLIWVPRIETPPQNLRKLFLSVRVTL